MSLARTISLSPSDALLGEAVAARLAIEASAPTEGEVETFAHSSLTLELSRPGAQETSAGGDGGGVSPPRQEPAYWFPNCGTVCIGGEPIRTGRNGGTARLEAGARIEERFDLARGFPVEILDLGERLVSFTLGGGAGTVRGGPARLRIASGPGAVPLLQDVLDRGEVSTRYRAAALLRRMTGRGLAYDANGPAPERAAALAAWRAWWASEGRSLPWDEGASRARLAGEVDVQPPGRPGPRLGGAVLPRAELPPGDRWVLARALEAWAASGRRDDLLPGAALVADDAVAWPPGEGLLVCDKALETALLRALERLSREAPARPDERRRDGLLLVATAARAPSPALVPPLFRLEREVPPRAVGWAPTLALAGGLLDWLDDERVPVGV